ncbi:PAS domain-containing sensor histidine kinase [Postechiella marina]|uniref:histidine kinase n=1 Tax=Postechiella marina TaxID=943941 RepID=A0ABP8CES8_9FLAO
MAYPPNSLSNTSTDSVYLDFIQKAASIGTWEYDTKLLTLHWALETKKIHELPHDYVPNLEEALNFYKAGKNRDTITKLFSECIENLKSFDVELQITTAKGNDKWIRAIAKPFIENGELVKVLGLFQDIDQKTKISKELAAKEALLSKIFDHASIGKGTLDLEGKWLKVNNSLCEMLNYTEEELLKLQSFKAISHPEDKHIGLDLHYKMLDGDINNFQVEKRYISKNGKVIFALLSSALVKDSRGIPQFIIIQINDLTQIKKANQKIQHLLNIKEHQNKRLLNFAHIVSHNLRSHSGNLKMLLDIIKTDMPESMDNDVFPMLDLAVDQLKETVESLNEVATINIKNDVIVEPINLLKSFENVLNCITGQIAESRAKINIDIEPDIHVYAITAYLDSILLNFITNSIKYKKSNINLEIDIQTTIQQGYVIIKIKDNGLGIDLKKHKEKLFGMYKTFHNHKDARGIGLFITKNQVEAIGGKIEVDSTVNIGTTFYIHLKHYENN